MQNAQSSYKSQWATIFVLLYGSKTIKSEDFAKMLFTIIGDKWSIKEQPVIYTTTSMPKGDVITTGPWKGRDTFNKGPIITAVKWNIRKLDKRIITDEELGIIRSRYREKIIPLLAKIGLASEYIAARYYGTPFDLTVDKGFPPNPIIPKEDKNNGFPWYYWFAILGGLVVVHQVNKRLY